MERKLKRLFNYQKFAGNSRLSAMLDDVDGRYGGALSDNDLELVSAAGEADTTVHIPLHHPEMLR